LATKQIRIYTGRPLQEFLRTRPLNPTLTSLARLGLHGQYDESETITENVAINRLVERHQWLMKRSMPQLKQKTWHELFSAFNPVTEHSIAEIEQRSLVGGIADFHGIERGDEESVEDFLARAEELCGAEMTLLASLDAAQKLAVIEAIERFWGRDQKIEGQSWESIMQDVIGVEV
jgi:hypothetical protein